LATPDLPWKELDHHLRSFISRRVRNQADVDDLVQRVLLRVVTGIGSLRDDDRLYPWIYRTARNAIVDHYRTSSVRRDVASGSADDVATMESGTMVSEDETSALQELASCMAPMLSRLEPEYRDAVTLADLEGMNQADAAARAGISVSGMKSRVQRGRRQLKAMFEACCRIDLDVRHGVTGFAPRDPNACSDCDCD
jgi:RNA polymerase sigma-70 factor (ECF subfamily)